MLFFYIFIFIVPLSYQQESIFLEENLNYNKINIMSLKDITFYVDIENLYDNDEGIFTLNTSLKMNFDYYCTFKNNKDIQVSDKCEFKFLSSNYDNYYHFVFSKKPNNKYFFLTIKNKNTILNSDYFEINYNIPINQKEIKSLQTNNTIIELKSHIPIIYKFNLKKSKNINKGISYIFYSNSQYMTIYEGKILDNNNNENSKKKNEKIIIYTLNKNEYNEKITIKLFSPESKTITFGLRNENYQTETINELKRPKDKSLLIQILNPSNPFYLFGLYNSNSVDLIYIEQIYGEFNAYYSNEISNNKIFPNEKNGDKLNGKYIMVYSNLDIISVYCNTICSFNIHFISEESLNLKEINGDSNYYSIISNDIRKDYSFPNYKNYQCNIRTSNRKNTLIEFDNGTKKILDYKNYVISFIPPTPNFKCKTDGEESLLILTTNKHNEYENLKEGNNQFVINKKYVYTLPKFNNHNIKSFDFEIIGGNENHKFHFGYGNNNSIFKPDTQIIKDKNNKKTISLINPYRYTNIFLKDKEDLFFYISFSFGSSGTINLKLVKVEDKLEEIKQKSIKRFYKASNFTIEQNKLFNNYLVIIISKCDNKELDMYLTVNNEIIKREYLRKYFNYILYEDMFISYEISIKPRYENEKIEGFIFYYTYASFLDILKFLVSDNFNLFYEYDNKKEETILKWNSPISYKNQDQPTVHYNIYVSEKKNDMENFNFCSINEKNAKYTITNSNYTSEMRIKLNTKVDNYVYITGRIDEKYSNINPVFTYPNITIYSFVNENRIIQEIKKTNILKTLFWIIFVIVLLMVVFYFIQKYSKMKFKNLDINAVDNMNNINFTNLSNNLDDIPKLE